MSRLENNAKPVIVGLMNGSLKPDSLDDEQRRLLGRWAGKTALVESYAVGAERPIDPLILSAMRQYEDGDPGRFGVLAHTGDFNSIGHLQIGMISDLLSGDSIAATVVILGLPNLILTCGFPWPQLPSQYFCDHSMQIPVWPPKRHWQQMGLVKPSPAAPTPELELFLSLAERIEFRVLYR